MAANQRPGKTFWRSVMKTAKPLIKRTIGQWLRLMSIGLLAAIATSEQTVSIDYDSTVGFSK